LQFAVPVGCRCGNKETVALQLLTSVLTGVPEAASDGTVLPIAWNMLDATKINPDAMKFHDTMRRYSLPTASTAGSFENTPINA
jgi:hypothetical protein